MHWQDQVNAVQIRLAYEHATIQQEETNKRKKKENTLRTREREREKRIVGKKSCVKPRSNFSFFWRDRDVVGSQSFTNNNNKTRSKIQKKNFRRGFPPYQKKKPKLTEKRNS